MPAPSSWHGGVLGRGGEIRICLGRYPRLVIELGSGSDWNHDRPPRSACRKPAARSRVLPRPCGVQRGIGVRVRVGSWPSISACRAPCPCSRPLSPWFSESDGSGCREHPAAPHGSRSLSGPHRKDVFLVHRAPSVSRPARLAWWSHPPPESPSKPFMSRTGPQRTRKSSGSGSSVFTRIGFRMWTHEAGARSAGLRAGWLPGNERRLLEFLRAGSPFSWVGTFRIPQERSSCAARPTSRGGSISAFRPR